jgi:hypothetical protein
MADGTDRPGGDAPVERLADPVVFVAYGLSRDDEALATCSEIHAVYVHLRAWRTGEGQHLHDRALVARIAEGLTAPDASDPDGARSSMAPLRLSRWTNALRGA